MEDELLDMLVDMQKCSNFGICDQAVYDPQGGHVPRGFSGATGSLDEVYLVMVFAEPGFPLPEEKFSGNPERDLEVLLDPKYLRSRTNPFHANIRTFLDGVFPQFCGDFDRQLNHVWLTQSRLCSISEELGTIKRSARLMCSRKHLVEQVKLFPNAIVLLAGGKAREAAGEVEKISQNVAECGAFAPPGCNQKNVRKSHQQATIKCREYIVRMIAERSKP